LNVNLDDLKKEIKRKYGEAGINFSTKRGNKPRDKKAE